MNTKNIFNPTVFFSLSITVMLVMSACDRGSEYGTKTGGEDGKPEAYGLQEEDLPGMGQDSETEGNKEEYPAKDAPRNAVVAGEDNEAIEIEYGEADTSYDAQAAQYPTDKIKDDTNLNSNDPLQLDSDFESIKKKKLLATLNRHSTNLKGAIRNLQNAPGDAENATTIEGNIEKLKLYQKKIDREIAKVRAADEENFPEIAENAQAAIKGAGALIQSENMRIQQGY